MGFSTRSTGTPVEGAKQAPTLPDLQQIARSLSGGQFDAVRLKAAIERLGAADSWCGNALAAATRSAILASTAPKAAKDEILGQLRSSLQSPFGSGGSGGTGGGSVYDCYPFEFHIYDEPRDDWPAGPVQVKLDDGTVIGTATGAAMPRYVEVASIWLTWGLGQYIGSPFCFQDPSKRLTPPATRIQIGIGVAPEGTKAMAAQDGIYMSNTLSDAWLGWAPIHELFHVVQYGYISQAKCRQLEQEPGQLIGFWQEGTAETAAALLQPARGAIGLHWSSYAAKCQATAGFLTGAPSIFAEDYNSVLLWKYLLEQAQLPYPITTPAPNEAGREGDLLQHIYYTARWAESYALTTLISALDVLPPKGRYFSDFMTSDPQGLDVYDNEVLYGNWLVALFLKARAPESRFTFLEQSAPPPGMGDLPAILGEIPADPADPADQFGTLVRSLGPWSFLYRAFNIDYPAYLNGSKGFQLEFTADAGAQVLVQIMLLGPNENVVDLIRSRDGNLSRTVFSRGGLVRRVVACVATLENAQPVKVTLAPSVVPAAPDLMITRWNSPVGREYQFDPRTTDWDWRTPDLWLDDGLQPAHGFKPPDHRPCRLHVTVHNNGPVAATDGAVRVTCQPISPCPNDAEWSPLLTADGQPLLIPLGDVPAYSSVEKVIVCKRPGSGAYSLRAVIECAGDSSPANNAAVSSSDSLPTWPPEKAPIRPKRNLKLVWPTVQPLGIPPCDPLIDVRWGDLSAGESVKASVVGRSVQLELDPQGLATALHANPTHVLTRPSNTRFATPAEALDYVLTQSITVTASFNGRLAGGFTVRLVPDTAASPG